MTSPWTAPGSESARIEDARTGSSRTEDPSASSAAAPASPWDDPWPGSAVTAPHDAPERARRRELVARAPLFPLRPLGLGEILGGATGLYRLRPRPVLVVSAVVFAIATAITTMLSGISLVPMVGSLQTAMDQAAASSSAELSADASPAEALAILAGTLATGLISAVAVQVVTAAMAPLALGEATGRPLAVGEVWASARRHGPRAALLGLIIAAASVLLVGVLMVLGSLPLLLTGGEDLWLLLPLGLAVLGSVLGVLWIVARTTLATPALVLEGLGPIAALRRSFALTRGRRQWRVLGITLLLMLLASVAMQMVAGVFSVVAMVVYLAILIATQFQQLMLAIGVMLVLSMLGSFVASTLVQPFISAGTTVLYADERMRQEGWDVELSRQARESRGGDLAAVTGAAAS